MPPQDGRGEMPFLEHVEELRWRILYSLLAITLGTLAGWFVVEKVDVVGLLKQPIAPLIPGGRLVFTSPTEPFFITLKCAFGLGILLASPVVFYQIWAFLAPALYERERRYIMPSFSVGVVLFLAGAGVAYKWVLPRALHVLFSFQPNDLTPMITADNYFSIAAQFVIAFGLVTELPLVITLLAAFGLVTPQFLARHRRIAIVISAGAAALLTPPDALSMIIMMVPLWLLYEVSIVCAWIVTRRRARREAAGSAGPAGTAAAVLLLLALAPRLGAQKPALPPHPGDTTHALPGQPGAGPRAPGQALDTAAARQLGLPTAPSRSLPAADSTIDSLLKLTGYQVTRYTADTLVVHGDSQVIFLRGAAYVERETTKLEADSVRYQEHSCRLDATGDPHLFDQSTVLVGEGMRYDTCIKRGTVATALTDFQQGSATWYLRGNLAVDSGSTRLYGAHSDITSSNLPVPEYHFAAHEVKWLNKSVMVARPAVLYVRDVPIMWLPFMFQDIRSGRRSGFLVPRFGINDLVRPTRGYQRHFTNLGYYYVPNDYLDFLGAVDWYAGRSLAVQGQMRYHWLDRFVSGGISYTKTTELLGGSSTAQIAWQHQQAFDSRTHLTANVDYTPRPSIVQRNSFDPSVATAAIQSRVNFDKRFSWGALNIGGSRSQQLSNNQIQQTLPSVSLTPSPIDIGDAVTWSPAFSYSNTQTLHNPDVPIPVPSLAVPGTTDTLALTYDRRETDLTFGTPLRIGRWTWQNGFTLSDVVSGQRVTFNIPDSTVAGGVRHVLYDRTFATDVDWNTGINLPQVLSGTWKVQPQLSIVNTTGAGPFLLRNQFSHGKFVQQGKRLQLAASMSPTFFGFFPGFGPLERIRHSIAPQISWRYAPGSQVSPAYAAALDPTGSLLNAKSDPQQTISVGLTQTFEGKVRKAEGDTSSAPARKVRLLSIATSGMDYNFEQAKEPGRNGWQTQSLTNTFASDLLPGFSLAMSHDLWRGQVGVDTAKFDPFLSSVTASFAISPATISGLLGLLGVGHGRAPVPAATTPSPDTAAGLAGVPGPIRAGDLGRRPYTPGGGQAFSMSLSFSSTRTRPNFVAIPSTIGGAETTFVQPPGAQGGRSLLNVNMSFSPTPHWTAAWTTSYDFDTHQFPQHYLRLERDLHRWHASFAFAKSANGNFAFNFSISLLDQPDIKFDYEQQTYSQ